MKTVGVLILLYIAVMSAAFIGIRVGVYTHDRLVEYDDDHNNDTDFKAAVASAPTLFSIFFGFGVFLLNLILPFIIAQLQWNRERDPHGGYALVKAGVHAILISGFLLYLIVSYQY